VSRPRIFVDLDGTCAEWVPEGNWREKGYFLSLTPVREMTETLRLVSDIFEIHVLSWAVSPTAEKEKRLWVSEYMPFVKTDRVHIVPYGASKQKYVPGGVKQEDLLIDDYTPALFAWKAAGGRPVKFYNGLNGTQGRYRKSGGDMICRQWGSIRMAEELLKKEHNFSCTV